MDGQAGGQEKDLRLDMWMEEEDMKAAVWEKRMKGRWTKMIVYSSGTVHRARGALLVRFFWWSLPFAAVALNLQVERPHLISSSRTNKDLSYLFHLLHVLTLFYYLQVAVTLFLALVVGAIFFGVKEDQTGSQNRCFCCCCLFFFCQYIVYIPNPHTQAEISAQSQCLGPLLYR